MLWVMGWKRLVCSFYLWGNVCCSPMEHTRSQGQFSLWLTKENAGVGLWKYFPAESSEQMRHRRNLTLIHSVMWVIPISRGLFIQQQNHMISMEAFQMSFKNKFFEGRWQRVHTSTIWWWPCHWKMEGWKGIRELDRKSRSGQGRKVFPFFFFFKTRSCLSFICSNSTGLWSPSAWLRFEPLVGKAPGFRQQGHKHATWAQNGQGTQVNRPCGWLWDLLGLL